MAKVDSLFLALGATYLVIGMALGIHMGATHDFLLTPVHAHVDLVGFAAHSVFGMAYKLWPWMKTGVLALAHAVLFGISAPLLMIGIVLTLKAQSEVLVIVASFGVILGVLAFAINAWRNWARA